ncbi:MAG: VWA domain-containing protein, partial [Planctomycetaceae bacterium]|nr:VWA domain-containing protein [Planctomycetaceae bacterium]
YSSSHQPTIERQGERGATCKLEFSNVSAASDFRLYFNASSDPVGLSLLGYKPVANEDGYFLLLANPEVKPSDTKPLDKTILFVVDRSGSMSGEKIVQAREALKFVLQRLNPGDLFNIIDYSDEVASFRPELLQANAQNISEGVAYADRLRAGGSTNIDGALQTGLKMLAQGSQPQYVLFFTDGLPTSGERNELKIAERARQSNVKNARLFNFGVGYDVNSRLLDRLSRDNRGISVYIRPNENLETVVSSFFNRIGEPQLTDLQIVLSLPGSSESIALQSYPRNLPDLFAGEQLVWVGRYNKGGDVQVTLNGKSGSNQQTYSLQAKLPTDAADSSTSFIEKLWATRRIGEIIDQLDLNGKNQELIDEMVQLSMKHGIMTPYTSFLAREDVSLANRASNLERASQESEQLSISGGEAGFAQRAFKSSLQNSQNVPAVSSPSLGRFGASLPGLGSVGDTSSEDKKKERETLRQIQAKTFFLKQNRWYDSHLKEGDEKNAKQIRQYSDEWFDLAAKNSGEYAPLLAQSGELVLELGDVTYHILPAE